MGLPLPSPSPGRCVFCLTCANAVWRAPGGSLACAAGVRPPGWMRECDHFVRDARRVPRTGPDRRPGPGAG